MSDGELINGLRGLSPLAAEIAAQTVSRAALDAVIAGPVYRSLVPYFNGYPECSLMGPHSRAVLYSLARMLRPATIAEIGTLHAGTSEVLARALWENGSGLLLTTDPFGADRCPPVIASWPAELQQITEFHPLNSMDFLLMLERRRLTLDLVLIDGNHDYEFALFDLQMAARLLRPGGVIVMDNSDQTGPFEASRQFTQANPAWRELGDSLANHDPSNPFDETRASLPNTAFILLQAPALLAVGERPWSTGVLPIAEPYAGGIRLRLAPRPNAGTLHYRMFVRAFADGNRWVGELATKGAFRIEAGIESRIDHIFAAPLTFDVPPRFGSVPCNAEIDLCWRAESGSEPLSLLSPPAPIGR